MLSAKPWKADAIARLGLSVIVCVFAGSLLVSAQHLCSAGGKVSARMFYPLAVAALGCLAATLVLLSKPWPLEGLSRRLLTLMVCAYSGLVPGLLGAASLRSGRGGQFHLAGRRGLAEFPGRRADPDCPFPARAPGQLVGSLWLCQPAAQSPAVGGGRRLDLSAAGLGTAAGLGAGDDAPAAFQDAARRTTAGPRAAGQHVLARPDHAGRGGDSARARSPRKSCSAAFFTRRSSRPGFRASPSGAACCCSRPCT